MKSGALPPPARPPGTTPPPSPPPTRPAALGSRVKYLIDTPETIWGCLDGKDYLEAARRYVRAGEVHRALGAAHPKAILHRFPLLQHQWPLVKKFRWGQEGREGGQAGTVAGAGRRAGRRCCWRRQLCGAGLLPGRGLVTRGPCRCLPATRPAPTPCKACLSG